MTVLINDGQIDLRDLNRILDIFLADIDPSQGFFIKPNIVFPVKPGSGEITSPMLVKTLVAALRERYSNIDILLGEGVAAGCNPEENFQVSGYTDLADELNIPLIDLHQAERITLKWKFGKIKLPRVAFERTYINLPVLKPSSACVISGALKNQKGLLLPEIKKHFHRLGLHEQIAEQNTIVKPALSILDCRNFFTPNILVSGNNCGEIDAVACDLLGIDKPEHILLSKQAGVFADGFSLIKDEINIKQILPSPEDKESKSFGRLRLWSNPQACTMCRYLFHDIQKDVLKPRNFFAGVKIFLYSLKGAEIVMGLNPKWRKEYETVICMGTCTRNLAKQEGYIHIPGCPPTPDDFYDNLP